MPITLKIMKNNGIERLVLSIIQQFDKFERAKKTYNAGWHAGVTHIKRSVYTILTPLYSRSAFFFIDFSTEKNNELIR